MKLKTAWTASAIVILIVLSVGISYGDTFGEGMKAYESGDFAGAIDAFGRALDGYRDNTKDPLSEANCLLYLSMSYLYVGRFDRALAFIDKTPPILEKADNNGMKQEMLNLYGLIYMSTGHFDNAAEHYERALQMSGSTAIRAEIFNNLGTLHVLMKSYGKAMEYYEKGLEGFLCGNAADKTLYAQILTNMAVLYISLKEESRADEKLKEAFSQFHGVNDSHKKVEGLINIAKAYISMAGKSNIHNAYNALEEAQTTAVSIGDNRALPFVFIYKSKLYEGQNDYKSALVLLRKSLSALRSLMK